MNYSAGDIVLSLSGHDAGRYYAVIGTDKNRVLLSDGYYSIISCCKAKNPKHIRFVYHSDRLQEYIAKNKLYDCHIRYELLNMKDHIN